MSNLYMRTHTDMRDKPATARANKKVSTIHSWGSANESKKAVTITTRWDKETPKPTIVVELEQGVAYEVIGPKGNTIALTR